MTFTQARKAAHRRISAAWTAARIGQFTGALLIAGGVAALALGHLAGAWAGLTGLVMVSTFRAHPPGVLAIAARTGARGRGAGSGKRCPRVRRRPGR
jgi:hypothetical protein